MRGAYPKVLGYNIFNNAEKTALIQKLQLGFEQLEVATPGDAGFGVNAVHAHNDYLEEAAELGLPGALLFAAAFLGGLLLFLPWMLTKLMVYTTSIIGNLGRYAH